MHQSALPMSAVNRSGSAIGKDKNFVKGLDTTGRMS